MWLDLIVAQDCSVILNSIFIEVFSRFKNPNLCGLYLGPTMERHTKVR